ncbi:restriction endonuclease S subunits-like protein [Methyloglobulus morosus KoM1]|uniref:Restriction endonuclease S subunits-like protein n=1 Tax=Methyloglobulus morosus KoM1 TaxID=1116472 RepID=V5BZL0_9GAMM|nr:restriction endonuclease subunit S [Methyloglobulus morosus]ESS71667.1 restriction endonuclease S subunits-like protein [Methyloglobulus morosus KoM1]
MGEKLGKLISITKGNKHSVADTISNESKRVLSIVDLRHDINMVFTNDSKGTEVTPDDIMIAWDGANAGTIGYGKSGYIGSTIARLRFKEKGKFNTAFVGIFLKTQFAYLRQTSTGATIPHISRSALESIKLPLLKLDDQIRIATLLSRVEVLIATRKDNLRLLDEFLKSTFFEMFGILNAEYKTWMPYKLSDLTEIVSGATKGKKYNVQEMIEAPYMRVANVQDGHLNLTEIKTIFVSVDEFNRYQLQKGDILLTEGGDPDKLGRGAVWEGEIKNCIHQNHIYRVRITNNKLLNPYFLSALVGSIYGKSYFLKAAKQTTGIATINSTQLKSFPIFLPPIELQNQFSAIVDKTESLKGHYQHNLTELENLYGALSQKAFKGELDLSRVQLITEKSTENNLNKETVTINDKGKADNLKKGMKVTKIKTFQELFDDFISKSKGVLNLDEFWKVVSDDFQRFYDHDEQYTYQPYNINEYEQVKNWLFELINKDKVSQSFNVVTNQIELRVNK